jgi:hypothetical protein
MTTTETSPATNPMAPVKHAICWLLFGAMVVQAVWSCRIFSDFGKLFLQLKGKSLIERASIGASEWQSCLARSGRREAQQTFAKVHREIAQASEHGKTTVRVIFVESGVIIINPHARSVSRKLQPITVVRSEEELPPEWSAHGAGVLVRSEAEFASDVEASWSFAAQQELPKMAKVFLNERDFALYLIGAFFWYPARVDVDLSKAEIRNEETFDAAFSNSSGLDRDDLRALKSKLGSVGYNYLVTRENGGLTMLSLGEVQAGDSK